ncbi:MAG: hypothetical protein K5888_07410 [Lachnospiraceae bacterium]|nr:hypothetical protein [Lachnospiraceae bacterium]
MKTIKNELIVCGVLFIGWLICGLVMADYDSAGFYYWAGFAFGLISVCAVAVSCLLQKNGSSASTEVDAVPTIISLGYIAISFILNIFFMIQGDGDNNKVLVVLNILLLLAFILLFYFSCGYKNRVADQLDLMVDKTTNTTQIVSLVAALLAQANDPDIKKRLHSFKEKIDYSPNISQNFSLDAEEKLIGELNEIKQSLGDNASKDKVLSMIDEAEKTWSTRNSMISTVR